MRDRYVSTARIAALAAFAWMFLCGAAWVGSGAKNHPDRFDESVIASNTFVVRAFRAPLYDPEGRLPRFERRGRIEGGKLVVDRSVHRVAAGGPSFPGHMREYGRSYEPR